MFCLLVLLNIAWVSAVQLPADDASTLGAWISVLVSRGVYILLASLIALCFIVTTVRNKLEERAARRSGNTESWTSPFWKGTNPCLTLPAKIRPRNLLSPTGSDYDSLCDRLKEAEMTITSLKTELDTANKAKIDLENTLDLYERQKTGSEDEVLKLQIDRALELEALKKEVSITDRKLQIAVDERDGLEKDVESLKREARITEYALKDQLNLTKRLEKAKAEIDSLKIRINEIKSERDVAVKLASDMIEKSQGVDSKDNDQRRILEQMIEDEVKKMRLELDDAKDTNSEIEESYTNVFENDIQNNKRDKTLVLTDDSIDDQSIIQIKNKQSLIKSRLQEKNSNENINMTFSSPEEIEDDEENEDKKLVTSSPAFRAFWSSLSQTNNY